MLVDYCELCGSDSLEEFSNGDVICLECGHVENVDEEE